MDAVGLKSKANLTSKAKKATFKKVLKEHVNIVNGYCWDSSKANLVFKQYYLIVKTYYGITRILVNRGLGKFA